MIRQREQRLTMSLRLYNTLTRSKEEFTPLDAKNVRLYVCGPTVYDFAHIGNARPAIVFDVLFRILRHSYGADHVTYVRNITDIDDKINARAAAEGITIRELTEQTYRIYNEDIAALGNLPPTHTPRATEHVQQMIAMIESLIANGDAYEAQGHVLFDVSSKADYGKLARRSLDDMIAGARVDVAPYKKGAMDFVLWKPSDAQTPGWDSPWGLSNARRWRANIWARHSTSTVAESIWSFRTTKTKSPNRKPPITTIRSPKSGCTTVS
jgi:cysteinyl-tRNA synthetase